jgi:hypothetical protein
MIVVKETKFSDDEYRAIERVTELIEEWRASEDSDVVDNLMDKIVVDTYGTSRPSPDREGWLEFIRTALDELADYMADHEQED